MAAPQLTQPSPRRLTRAEYDRMVQLGFFRGERLELIHGSLLRIPPIGPPQAAVGRFSELRRFQRGERVRPEAFGDVELLVGEILP